MTMTKKEVDTVLSYINSFDRFHAFIAIKPLLRGKLFWYALREAYGYSDNLYYFKEDVILSFLSKELYRNNLMNYRERKALKALPKKITIYRGMTKAELKSNYFGVSWTLKKSKAEFFAYRYIRNFSTNKKQKTIHKLVIDKSEVIAFFNDRKEFEIIYIPKYIKENIDKLEIKRNDHWGSVGEIKF